MSKGFETFYFQQVGQKKIWSVPVSSKVTVGRSPSNQIRMERQGFPVKHELLVVRHGKAYLKIPPEWSGAFHLADRQISFEDLHALGFVETTKDLWLLPLQSDMSGRLICGDTVFTFRLERSQGRRPDTPKLWTSLFLSIPWFWMAMLILSGLVHVAMYAFLLRQPPEMRPSVSSVYDRIAKYSIEQQTSLNDLIERTAERTSIQNRLPRKELKKAPRVKPDRPKTKANRKAKSKTRRLQALKSLVKSTPSAGPAVNTRRKASQPSALQATAATPLATSRSSGNSKTRYTLKRAKSLASDLTQKGSLISSGELNDRAKGPVSLSSGTTQKSSGEIDLEASQRVFKQNTGQMRSCFERALAVNASVGGKYTLTLTIGMDGMIQRVRWAPDPKNPILTQCVERRMRTWRFPKPKSQAEITVPVVFKGG